MALDLYDILAYMNAQKYIFGHNTICLVIAKMYTQLCMEIISLLVTGGFFLNNWSNELCLGENKPIAPAFQQL
jgi:hypothetical protein